MPFLQMGFPPACPFSLIYASLCRKLLMNILKAMYNVKKWVCKHFWLSDIFCMDLNFFVMVILFVCLNKTLLEGLLLTEVCSMFLLKSLLCTEKTHGSPLSHDSWLTAEKGFRALLEGDTLLFTAMISVLSLLWNRWKKRAGISMLTASPELLRTPLLPMDDSDEKVDIKV